MRLLLVFALLLSLALPGPAARAQAALGDAVGSRYRVDGWQAEEGLPVSAVQALQQTREGTLWVGTGSGLVRFDGLAFNPVQAESVPALSRRPIFGLLEDRQGTLWVGHAGGAARRRGGEWEPAIDPALLNGRRVWAFAQAADDTLWGATEGGLVHWRADGSTRVYREADGLPGERLRTLVFDNAGTLWIGSTGAGLFRLQGGHFEPVAGFPHTEVRHLLADPGGGVWAATPGAGLVRVHANGEMQRYTQAQGLPTDQLTFLSRDTEGAIWIGTWGAGVSRWRDGRFSTVNSEQGLGGDQIWTVHADREGSLWVGSWTGGLNRLRPRGFPVVGKPEGLAADNVRAVLQARDGTLWVSTAGGGVSRVGLDGHIQNLGLREGLATLEMSALYEDHDGAIWLGSYTAGLARWHQGRIERFGTAEGLPHVDVRSLLRDRQGRLWVGTRAGLARQVGARFEAVQEAGAPKEGVTSMLEDRQGRLWFGSTGDGLLRFENGRFSRLTRQDGLPSNWILALHEDEDGTLWIGSNGEGIGRLREGQLRKVRPTDGLWDGLAQVFMPDAQDRLWISCNRGFYVVARRELNDFLDGRLPRVHSTGYGVGEALRSTTFAGGLQPVGARDPQGRIWLPSLKGLVRVDPQRLPQLGAPPAVRIEAVRLSGHPLPLAAELQLPPGAAPPLSIRYAAATVQHAERVRFRYRMEGMTPDWIEVGGSREITFPALPHGQYRLFIASSLDGEHWQTSAELPVIVQPHLHERRSMQALAALAALLAALGLYLARTRQMRHRQAEMERLVAEQTEELRRANEHLAELSFSDALTGLANRRRFDEQLQLEWRRCARQGQSLALVLADIDAFKAYNDSLGHAAGDSALRAVADVIRQTGGRASDCAARYGGEEFVLLLPGLDLPSAQALAERLRVACEARALPHPASPVAPIVTLSLGVAALVPDASLNPMSLFTAADAALYRAKQGGRNRVA